MYRYHSIFSFFCVKHFCKFFLFIRIQMSICIKRDLNIFMSKPLFYHQWFYAFMKLLLLQFSNAFLLYIPLVYVRAINCIICFFQFLTHHMPPQRSSHFHTVQHSHFLNLQGQNRVKGIFSAI